MQDFSKPNELLERELKVSPLAAQTYSKSYRYFCKGIAPSFMDRGEGCYIYDVDGNRFIDFMCGLGPVTVGYNVPSVIEETHMSYAKQSVGESRLVSARKKRKGFLSR